MEQIRSARRVMVHGGEQRRRTKYVRKGSTHRSLHIHVCYVLHVSRDDFEWLSKLGIENLKRVRKYSEADAKQ